MASDDLGHPVALAAPPRRVVSLVPSITEALALSRPERIVGATEFCVRPADLAERAGHRVLRVAGPKNPDLAAITALAPDLVVANKEENRREDVEALRSSGVPVWVTDMNTVDEALASMGRLFRAALGLPGPPGWLVAARRAWQTPDEPVVAPVVVCVWRDPWMVIGPRTYSADLLRRCGFPLEPLDVPGWPTERYPAVSPDTIRGCGTRTIVLLDAPYPFAPDDGPECFPGRDVRILPERPVVWYGPGMVDARDRIRALLGPRPA
ncbi:helical backbone metal receptor [uncultured Propionibacterium sp.]|uniref:helical backbone metal receptor n=1 Tax=uncultured Propionibacterium sp. TaxID=218066 RepID=UPI00292DDCBB|nr:helical backbone metal receptor [uncultured Propionibacterium sp.]